MVSLIIRVVRALASYHTDPGSIPGRARSFSKRSPVHPAVNGYLTLFRVGEGEGSEGEEMGTTLIMLALDM